MINNYKYSLFLIVVLQSQSWSRNEPHNFSTAQAGAENYTVCQIMEVGAGSVEVDAGAA
jgi:hypothetical protein